MSTSIFLQRASRLILRKAVKVPMGVYAQATQPFLTHKYHCPCCTRPVPLWLDYDSNYKKVVCPFCESHPRHRSLAIYLERFRVKQMRTEKILHVAPENSITRKLRSLGASLVVTLDPHRSGVDIRASLESLPFADQTFDAVVCSHVLEHVTNDQKAMREIARVLQPEGWAFVGVPLDYRRETTYEDSTIQSPEEKLTAFGREDHLRVYGRDFPKRLELNGLRLQSISPSSFLTLEERLQFGLETEDLLFAEPIRNS